MVKNVAPAGLRIARLAYVMHYSLVTLAQMMRTMRLHARSCTRLGKVFGAHPHPATITHNPKASVLASSAPTCSSITRDTMDCDPYYERMAAKSVRVSSLMYLTCTERLRSSALNDQVKVKSLQHGCS
jgi:hypothetical protein